MVMPAHHQGARRESHVFHQGLDELADHICQELSCQGSSGLGCRYAECPNNATSTGGGKKLNRVGLSLVLLVSVKLGSVST